ncbi:MAG: RluA family pseudouridine synthase [Clostridia bacterium]|nr:RluA family pseudouridine synthase [Clostridia bacterium]
MEFNVSKESVGERLDNFIVQNVDSITRSYIKKLIDDEHVVVNQKKQKAGYALKENDIVSIDIPEDKEANIQAEDIKLNIVYEDEDILIIDKEKGMVVHPANGNYSGTMVNSLMYTHKDKLSSINGIVRPGIVHRIDKDTSGILVVAKNDNAHKKLSEQFKVHSITRKYIAIVKGIITEENLVINYPIGRSSKDRKKMAVTYKNSKEAITHIKVLRRFYDSNVTVVEATLETGRTHQIRVHMAYIGHPLVGDEVYGNKDTKFKVSGQMLHAKVLGFIHPTTGKYVEFESDLPEYYKEVLKKLENKEQDNN